MWSLPKFKTLQDSEAEILIKLVEYFQLKKFSALNQMKFINRLTSQTKSVTDGFNQNSYWVLPMFCSQT